MTIRLVVCLSVLVCCALVPVHGQILLTRDVLGTGASDMRDATHRLRATLGQPIAGVVSSADRIAGQGFWYQRFSVATFADDVSTTASGIRLHPNYPNPFNPSTLITFELPVRGYVRLLLYQPSGRLLAVLVEETLPAGTHRIRFQADGLPAGMYVCRLISGRSHAVRTMLLLK